MITHWPLILKTFLAMPAHAMNICSKIPPLSHLQRYRVMRNLLTDNGLTDNPKTWCFPPTVIGGGINSYCHHHRVTIQKCYVVKRQNQLSRHSALTICLSYLLCACVTEIYVKIRWSLFTFVTATFFGYTIETYVRNKTLFIAACVTGGPTCWGQRTAEFSLTTAW